MGASKVVGARVYDHDNRSIGSVKDVILDKSRKVDSVGVGGLFGLGDKNVAVSMSTSSSTTTA
jgi:sporulation protein YlmC with PRC-barrel domain